MIVKFVYKVPTLWRELWKKSPHRGQLATSQHSPPKSSPNALHEMRELYFDKELSNTGNTRVPLSQAQNGGRQRILKITFGPESHEFPPRNRNQTDHYSTGKRWTKVYIQKTTEDWLGLEQGASLFSSLGRSSFTIYSRLIWPGFTLGEGWDR